MQSFPFREEENFASGAGPEMGLSCYDLPTGELSPNDDESRPAKRFCPDSNLQGLDPHGLRSPLEKLTSGQYFGILQQLECKEKAMRGMLSQGNYGLAEQMGLEIHDEVIRLNEEFFIIKSTYFLHPGDMDNLLELEEILRTHITPQLRNFDMEMQQALTKNKDITNLDLPISLSIVSQGNAGPIFKEKPIGPFILRIMTGGTVSQIHCDPVQPEIVETSQRVKRNNSELENQRLTFKENGTVMFSDLKFSSGTFPNFIRIKFRCNVSVTIGGQKFSKMVESPPSKPFISMTNTGSQWKDAAGSWMK